MAEPANKELYDTVKRIVNSMYSKNSAYRSGMYVQLYKRLGGTYKLKKDKKQTIDDYPLKRWFNEKWQDVNPNKTEESYPVYRPTKRITKETPKTKNEINKKTLEKQAELKQKIKGSKNLPKF